MLDRTDTGVSVGQLARVGFRISDELLEGLGRQGRMHGDAEDIGRHARNRVQVLDRIILRPALEQGLVDMRNRAAQHKGVAVRAGARDRGNTQRTAAATDVFNHHSAE